MTGGRPKEDYFEVYTSSNGETLEICPVPQHIVRTVKPTRAKPKRPTVEMKLKGGATQRRWAKDGDEGWAEYQAELDAWEEEQDELQRAVTYCLALRRYAIPSNIAISDLPDYIQDMINTGLVETPNNPWAIKFLWLRSWVIGDHDEFEISLMLQKMSGVPEEMVEQIKSNFRGALLGTSARLMGEGNEVGSGEGEDNL